MVTKSGRHHFSCKLSTYLADGTLAYSCENYTFTSFDADDYIKRSADSYAADGIRAVYENVIDLDDEEE